MKTAPLERKRKQSSSGRRERLRSTNSNRTEIPQTKHASLKTLKKKKKMKMKHDNAVEQKTKYDKNHVVEAITGKVVTKTKSPGDKPTLIAQHNMGQHKKKKKKSKVGLNNEDHGSKLLEVVQTSFVTPQHIFASNYQQLVQQAMEVTSKGGDCEEAIPVVPQASFENNYRHLVTSALCLEKTVATGNHKKKSTMPVHRESIASMFRHGFSNAEISATPNDRSHIPQFADIGANESVAEFSRCGRSGAIPLADESDEDVPGFMNPVDQSTSMYHSKWINADNSAFHSSKGEANEKANIVEAISFHSVPNNKYVVIMKHPAILYFQGQLQIRVIAGSLQVLGHTLSNACSDCYLTSSPTGYSKLSLKTVDANYVASKINIEAILVAFGLDSKVANDIAGGLNVPDCVLVIEKAVSPFATYLASHCSINLYPKITNIMSTRPLFEEEKRLQCQFEYDSETVSKCHKEPPEWSQLANYVAESIQTDGPTRVMICGGKSVGKSTLLRFLINQCLATTEEVLCLDFDPGQSEFTIPGSVSVVRVTMPLLGPSFTHLLEPERMVYIGNVDVSQCPDRYIRSAQHIIEYCLSQPKLNQMPWFINTMGFTKGIGVDLTANLICLLNPTQVVQIQSKSAKRNYPKLLSSENVSAQRSALLQLFAPNHSLLNYSLHIIPSAAEDDQPGPLPDWGLPPKIVRSVMILAYFYGMLKAPRFSLTDIVPRKIPFSKLKLGICHESVHYAQLLNVMNANLVALCVATDDEYCLQSDDSKFPQVLVQPPISPCLGFGVVRGTDVPGQALYLISPLHRERLEEVNCLLAGSVTLPASLYTNATSGLGHMPYVSIGSGQPTSDRITRRFVRPSAKQNQRKH